MPGPIRILMPGIFATANDQKGPYATHGMQAMSSMVDGIEKGLRANGMTQFNIQNVGYGEKDIDGDGTIDYIVQQLDIDGDGSGDIELLGACTQSPSTHQTGTVPPENINKVMRWATEGKFGRLDFVSISMHSAMSNSRDAKAARDAGHREQMNLYNALAKQGVPVYISAHNSRNHEMDYNLAAFCTEYGRNLQVVSDSHEYTSEHSINANGAAVQTFNKVMSEGYNTDEDDDIELVDTRPYEIKNRQGVGNSLATPYIVGQEIGKKFITLQQQNGCVD